MTKFMYDALASDEGFPAHSYIGPRMFRTGFEPRPASQHSPPAQVLWVLAGHYVVGAAAYTLLASDRPVRLRADP